ncbi:MAG: peptidoglycan-binding protein [Pseudomonadota bacterium]
MLRLLLGICLLIAPVAAQAQAMSRQDMIHVQGYLSDMGYDLAVDGAYGPGTARAIREFQTEQGLPVTGEPSQTLLDLLRALHASGWYRQGTPQQAAQGPSFDCAKAGNASELAICGDGGLSFLDRELSASYSAVRNRLSSAGRTQLASDQRAWLADRNRCGSNVQCLRFAMEARIGQLR